MARTRATEAESVNCSSPRDQMGSKHGGREVAWQDSWADYSWGQGFVSVYLCTHKYQPPKYLILSLGLHLPVGIMYQKNGLCKWLLLPLGNLPVLNTLKPYLWDPILNSTDGMVTSEVQRKKKTLRNRKNISPHILRTHTLGSDYLGVNPSYTTYLLCALRQVSSLLGTSISSSINRENNCSSRIGLLEGLNELMYIKHAKG